MQPASRQLDRQAWAQVEQGNQATQALYSATQKEMENLATLTAQRLTLQRLLAQRERRALNSYLQTLRNRAGLDLILVCNENKQLLGQAGEVQADNLCTVNGYNVLSVETKPDVWMLATHLLEPETTDPPVSVIVGVALDDGFAWQMHQQTGLEHTLLITRPRVTRTSWQRV